MATEKDTPSNPPAFPQTPETLIGDGKGMTLRDYFAAAALQGLITNGHMSGSLATYANEAFRYADAMLREREKGGL